MLLEINCVIVGRGAPTSQNDGGKSCSICILFTGNKTKHVYTRMGGVELIFPERTAGGEEFPLRMLLFTVGHYPYPHSPLGSEERGGLGKQTNNPPSPPPTSFPLRRRR